MKTPFLPPEGNPGREALEAVQKEARRLITTMEGRLKAELPELTRQGLEKLPAAAEAGLTTHAAEVMRGFRQRAGRVERLNDSLANFELSVSEALTRSDTAIIVHEIHKLRRKFEWILGHIGEITLLFAAVLGYAKGRFGGEIWDTSQQAWRAILHGDVDKFTDKLADLYLQEKAALEWIAEAAVYGLLASIMSGALLAIAAAVETSMLIPIQAAKTKAEAEILGAALPQRPGRVRRIKRRRQRATGI